MSLLSKTSTGIVLILLLSLFGCSKEESSSVAKADWITQPSASESISESAPELIGRPSENITSGQVSADANAPITLPYLEASAKLRDQPLVQNYIKSAQGKIQVIEFFSYACHWCGETDRYLQEWLKTKPADVVFERIPVLFHPSWAVFAKVYYMVEALAAEHHIDSNPIHAHFFQALHENPSIGSEPSALYAFFVKEGLYKADSQTTFTERFEAIHITQDFQLAYGITATPLFVVQGKKGIYSTTATLAGTQENLFVVLDHLIAENRV